VSATAARPANVVGAVAVSTAAQVVAKIAHLALNLVASLVLIRYLQPAGYGDYVFVLSFAALFGLMSDLGLSKIAVRDISRNEQGTAVILGTAIVGKLLLAAVSAALVQIALAMIDARPEIRLAIAVASLMYVTEAFLSIVVIFQVRLAMQYEALVTVVIQAIDTVLILGLVALGADLIQLVAAPVASGAAGCVLVLVIARRRFAARLDLDLRRLPGLLWEAAPIGITLLLAVAYLKLDSVLLGLLATPVDVGLYGSAFRPIEYLLLASGVLITPLFPLLARWYGRESARFTLVYWRGMDALLVIALPVPVLLFWVADPLVRGVYTESFASAAVPLRVLSIALVLMIVSAWQGFALLAAGRQRLTVIYDAAALILNVGLNLALIPRFGYLGAAAAALVTSGFVVACSSLVARHVLMLSGTTTRLTQISAANVALAGAVGLSLAAGAPWWLALALSPLPYVAALLAFRVTTLAELRELVPASSNMQGATLVEVGP
jgi:O-antigen/teichoic acid export membrane protein